MYANKWKYGTPGEWVYYFCSNFLPYIIVLTFALWLRHEGCKYWWSAFIIVTVITRDWAPAPWKIRQWYP